MTQIKSIALVVMTAFAISACSAITSFDKPGNLYSLHQNMGTAVTVTLFSASNTGTLALGFTEPLPEEDNATLLAILDASIVVNIANDTAVNYNLTEGTRVVDTPNESGEYMLALSADRKTIDISFYNLHANTSMQAGGTYVATITVSENALFEVESLTRPVTVVGG